MVSAAVVVRKVMSTPFTLDVLPLLNLTLLLELATSAQCRVGQTSNVLGISHAVE